MKIYNIRYYLPIRSNKTSARQNRELRALDENRPQYHKYQREYRIYCWMPPITVLPPEDNSIRNDY